MSAMENRVEYIYIERNKESGSISSFKSYKVDKTQKEMDELVDKYNNNDEVKVTNEEVKDPKIKEIIKLALKWKSDKTLETISRDIDDVYNEIDNIRYSIDEYLEDLKGKK